MKRPIEVINYLVPQKYEEPQLSRATGGLPHSEWTAELVFSKSCMGLLADVETEVGTEACPEDSKDGDSGRDEPIRVTVVRDAMRRPSRTGNALVKNQYLSRRNTISGGKIIDWHEKEC